MFEKRILFLTFVLRSHPSRTASFSGGADYKPRVPWSHHRGRTWHQVSSVQYCLPSRPFVLLLCCVTITTSASCRYSGPYHHAGSEASLPHSYTDLYSSQWRCPPPAPLPTSTRASSSPTPTSSALPQYTPSPHSSPLGRPDPSPSDYSLVRPTSSPSDYSVVRPTSSPSDYPAPSPAARGPETYLPSPMRGSETYYTEYNQHYYQAYYFSHRQDWAPNQ